MASQTLRTLKLSLLADVTNFTKGLDNAGSGFDKFTRGVQQASKFATVALGAIGGLAASAINAASDLSETSAAIDQVFGREASRQLQDFARGASQALGQSRQQALSAAQTFGVFGKAAGLSGDELVGFTTDLVTLAADLASFNNTSVDQAITALGAALRGESEPIRTYGVLLDDATLRARAFTEGLIESEKDALTPQIRTLAAFNEILAQTTIQQGDFQRTSDGLANSQRTLKAELENFRVELGEELLPVVNELLPQLRSFLGVITDTDPEKIVLIGTAIAGFAIAIKGLNAALSAYALIAANPLVAGLLAVAGISALGAFRESAQQDIQRRITEGDTRFGLADYTNAERAFANPLPLRSPGRNPETGFGRSSANQPIIINGVVGSPYQVYRELERQLAAGNRSGTGRPAPLGAR